MQFRIIVDGKEWEGLFSGIPANSFGISASLEDFSEENCSCERLDLKNESNSAHVVSDCYLGFKIHDGKTFHCFKSRWGNEFEPVSLPMSQCPVAQTTSGRSANGMNPWIGIDGDVSYQFAVGWSGNWKAYTEKSGDDYFLWIGFDHSFFYKTLAPGEMMSGPEIFLVRGKDPEQASCELRDFFFRNYSLIKKEGWTKLPLTYNTWWCYEDSGVNEDVCLENAQIAHELGITNFMLDSGWFGDSTTDYNWEGKRGDWDIINTKLFPHGIDYLGAKINEIGIEFGIWCEIEGLGYNARLKERKPELVSRRNGKEIGCVCMGNAETRAWAFQAISKLIDQYGAHWIKLDFNLDMGIGCDEVSHGHGKGDGLYEHYRGYYELLDTIRKHYPGVILENCSSGGLRIDLGMLQKTHFAFLSDPDWVEHHFQCYWGALSFLPAACTFHFTQSDCIGDHNENVHFPITENMPREKFDYIIRSCFMGVPGFCYIFRKWPQWCRDRLKELTEYYKKVITPYLLEGSVYRLCGQARANGAGDRWQIYQFKKTDSDLIFIFRLKNSFIDRKIFPYGIKADKQYTLTWQDLKKTETLTGREILAAGIRVNEMPEESSEILILSQAD